MDSIVNYHTLKTESVDIDDYDTFSVDMEVIDTLDVGTLALVFIKKTFEWKECVTVKHYLITRSISNGVPKPVFIKVTEELTVLAVKITSEHNHKAIARTIEELEEDEVELKDYTLIQLSLVEVENLPLLSHLLVSITQSEDDFFNRRFLTEITHSYFEVVSNRSKLIFSDGSEIDIYTDLPRSLFFLILDKKERTSPSRKEESSSDSESEDVEKKWDISDSSDDDSDSSDSNEDSSRKNKNTNTNTNYRSNISIMLPTPSETFDLRDGTEFKGNSQTQLSAIHYLVKKYRTDCFVGRHLQTEQVENDPYLLKLIYDSEFRTLHIPQTFWEDLLTCYRHGNRYIVWLLGIQYLHDQNHANVMIYDTSSHTLERFEPHGWVSPNPDQDFYIDSDIISVFAENLKDTEMYISRYYPSMDFCPVISFQRMEMDFDRKELDPGGFCAAWSLWYVELRLSNPGISRDLVLAKAIRSINSGRFTDFIRQYAEFIHRLRRENN